MEGIKGALRLVLADQLTHDLASLRDIHVANDVVMLCEVQDEVTYVRHHKRKVAFLFSAMRHFAEELRQKGIRVHYVTLDDPENAGSFTGEFGRAVTLFAPDRVILTEPGEYRVRAAMDEWRQVLDVDVEIRDDDRFLCTHDEFSIWAEGRKQLRMDFFYRDMRRRFDILMQGDAPIGGKWNYDADNRESPDLTQAVPTPYRCPPDDITKDVLVLVAARCADHFGSLDDFDFAVTRTDALAVLAKFIDERLPLFGKFQDAMIEDEPWMYHSHIGFYLNAGLLTPLEVIKAVEQAYHDGIAPLNSVEGFIRQILGWREFIRGIYWLKMPGYAALNYLEAKRALPEFFWTGDTRMNCMQQSIAQTERYAYAHHIQRLMVLGNFALLAGLDPVMVNEWYLVVYADAYEWVELPNVSGMVLFADGGYLASKPYAAGGAYINRMSNYCKNCAYKVTAKTGKDACPFNYLYWDFLGRNREKLGHNARLGMMYRSFDKMADEKVMQIKADAEAFFANLDNGVV
ncbi:MAG: cryptochrome/photolyase family protein [Candidatus Puniceispirillum sp.]|nr:cryptochrome/photolyase family protein [Candidatus Puniceispirillum sp.]MBT6565529.1 cryptochrome/photolyase family protein [Candidatus Puniceispirillum sp.]